MGLGELVQNWPKLNNLLKPIARKIAFLKIHPARHGHKAILCFTNDYGLEILKHPNEDFFKMAVIRFHGGAYEFAFDTPIPDLNLGYNNAEVLKLCQEVSGLK